MLSRDWINGFHATPDGGCIFANIHESWASTYIKHSTIIKIDSMGIVEWNRALPKTTPIPFIEVQETYDIAILPIGYACLSEDSIYLLSHAGVPIGKLNFHGPGNLIGFDNGDLFLNLDTNAFKARIDSIGDVRYTISTDVYNYDTTLYTFFADTLHQLEGMTGAFTTSIYFQYSGLNGIQMLSDGGWLRGLNRYDRFGSLKWSTGINVPHFGFNVIGEQSDGTLLTGGTYLSVGSAFGTFDYSSFITTIDTLGNSVIDSTTQVWTGDANDDGFFEFGDVVYVALARGSTGPQRYDTLIGNGLATRGDIAIDFPGSFAIGVNHKQCDFYPDGIIDSLDLLYTSVNSFIFSIGGVSTPWRLSQHTTSSSNSNSLLPYFSCLPDRDSATTGDTVRFYFILGDNGVVIDSIFGLAFFLTFDPSFTMDIGKVLDKEIIDSDLGSLPNQLALLTGSSWGDLAIMTSRRDLQNAYFVQDTIGYADIIILDSTSGNIDLTLTLLSFKAITAGGFPIDFQFNTKPVHLRSIINSVPEAPETIFTMYPVPAKDQLILDQLPAEVFLIQIYNYEGKLSYSEYSRSASSIVLNLEGYSPGLYLLMIKDAKDKMLTRKFVKE